MATAEEMFTWQSGMGMAEDLALDVKGAGTTGGVRVTNRYIEVVLQPNPVTKKKNYRRVVSTLDQPLLHVYREVVRSGLAKPGWSGDVGEIQAGQDWLNSNPEKSFWFEFNLDVYRVFIILIPKPLGRWMEIPHPPFWRNVLSI